MVDVGIAILEAPLAQICNFLLNINRRTVDLGRPPRMATPSYTIALPHFLHSELRQKRRLETPKPSTARALGALRPLTQKHGFPNPPKPQARALFPSFLRLPRSFFLFECPICPSAFSPFLLNVSVPFRSCLLARLVRAAIKESMHISTKHKITQN